MTGSEVRLRKILRPHALAGLVLAVTLPCVAWAGEGATKSFGEASVRFEQNATDGDFEVVFEVTGRREGLARLSVVAPDGHTVAGFEAPGASSLGIRQFRFESPEPSDAAALKAAYPAGVYRFAGATASGVELRGEATLSHELPATASLLRPAADADGVPATGLEIAWLPSGKAAGYIIEIEQPELGVSLKATLPGSATSFSVPEGFLRPGTEYDLGVGSVSEGGNVSVVETTFKTAKPE